MRIRLPFAAAFFILLLISSYLSLTALQLPPYINDKAVHLITFFLLTLCIYWIPDTTRRRTLHLTLTLSLFLSLASEILQGLLNNGIPFDAYDVLANVVGSLGAVGLCGWYHKRMLERRRRSKGYVIVENDAEGEELVGIGARDLGEGGDGQVDLELGNIRGGGNASVGQESGIVDITAPRTKLTLDQEVDNWDENVVDNWDEEDHALDSADGEGPKTPASSAGEVEGDITNK